MPRNFSTKLFETDGYGGDRKNFNWLPRSSDLNARDNALWGVITKRVSKKRYYNTQQWKDALRIALTTITETEFRKISLGSGNASFSEKKIMVCILTLPMGHSGTVDCIGILYL